MSAPSPRSVLPLKWEKRLPPKRGNPLPRMRHTPSVSLRVQRYNKKMRYANKFVKLKQNGHKNVTEAQNHFIKELEKDMTQCISNIVH